MRASGCLRKLPYGVCLVAMTYSDPVNDRAGWVGSRSTQIAKVDVVSGKCIKVGAGRYKLTLKCVLLGSEACQTSAE